jgi:hypothetical protein
MDSLAFGVRPREGLPRAYEIGGPRWSPPAETAREVTSEPGALRELWLRSTGSPVR